jgi:DNA-directed RNA polymerase subunit E'/Rpb7
MDPSSVAKKDARKKRKDIGVYMLNLLTRKIYINYNLVGNTIKEKLEQRVKKEIEGKCSIEGFIKPDSTKILSYSSGLLFEDKIMFEVVFECMVCCPVEGMHIKCKAENITQAGIRAVVSSEDISPVIIYISRDHHYNNKLFIDVKQGDDINIKVIGQRFELNDEHVSVIGELIESRSDKQEKYKKKPGKLVIQNA